MKSLLDRRSRTKRIEKIKLEEKKKIGQKTFKVEEASSSMVAVIVTFLLVIVLTFIILIILFGDNRNNQDP